MFVMANLQHSQLAAVGIFSLFACVVSYCVLSTTTAAQQAPISCPKFLGRKKCRIPVFLLCSGDTFCQK